jgi:prepilin-type processing-associated H-X9-DG protein
MYRVIGADQKEYGPVNADQIRQWIATGRANASTKVQAEGSTEWKPLSELPEFADALSTSNPPPPFSAAPQPANVQAPQTSGMAITSLVLGILAFLTCGLTGLPGLVLGIIALSRIKKSQGRLSGNGLAIAGICTSALFLLMLPILAGMLLPALAKAKQRAQTIQCVNNLKQLGIAVRIYSGDNKDQYPPAANWCDAIFTNVGSSNVFRCPGDLQQTCGYSFNSKLSGLKENEINPKTVLFFESDSGWNSSGGPEQMHSNRHGTRTVVCFADGSVMQLSPSSLNTLRWDP